MKYIKTFIACTVILFITVIPTQSKAVMIDGNGWVKLSQKEKTFYLMGYYDGVIAGVGQGVRFAMNQRTPDPKVFNKAFDIWANVGINTLLPKIDEYYSNYKKRKIMVMHAIMQILVEMKLYKMQ